MEERLDDAIHVLRNHAESGQMLPPGHPAAGMPGMMPGPHSNGFMPGSMVGSVGPYPPGMGMMDSMVSFQAFVSFSSQCVKKDHCCFTKH